MTSRHTATNAAKLVQAWEPGLMCRMGGAANGGSAKTPEERERLDQEHQGKDLDKPAGANPGEGSPRSPGSRTPDLPEPSRDGTD